MAKTVRIKEAISPDLALRSRADAFFDNIEQSESEVVVDFSGVRSISRSFAQQYLTRKRASRKQIRELHIPAAIAKMFEVVESAAKKTRVVDSDSMPLMSM